MKCLVSIFGASLVASVCLAIGSAVVTDTVQPMAKLTPLQAWQGASLTVLATVRQDGQPYTNSVIVVMQWGVTNATATATNGIAKITTGPLAQTGATTYYMSCVDGTQTNAMGAGILSVNATAFFGGN